MRVVLIEPRSYQCWLAAEVQPSFHLMANWPLGYPLEGEWAAHRDEQANLLLVVQTDAADFQLNHQKYNFDKGLPKIHEHDNKSPQGFGIIYKGRLVCFYDYECDLGDGWESYEVHKDSEDAHEKALKMGANILSYAFLNAAYK